MRLPLLLGLIFFSGYLNAQNSLRFESLTPEKTGINFSNKIDVNLFNFTDYNYFGNGSGVGVGDFNNDGFTDIFFSGNMVPFKLYLNEGKFKFKDVTKVAGIEGNGLWGTGVSIVDINGDGLLDIYVSHSGNYSFVDSNKLCNELYINLGPDKNGIPHFKEMAKKYGLDLPGSQTTQVVFFDYDRDGDLDAFVLNHAKSEYNVLYKASYFQTKPNKNFANRLLQNDNGHFVDVSKESGIIGSSINFGLGVAVSDLNNDGWPDIYCTSDFEERDFCYINQKDGTFKECLASSFGHISQFSMGVDIADINNDGFMDIMTVDMKPPSSYRQKAINMQDDDDKFRNYANLGFNYQYSRNMLQMNQGSDKNGIPHFSETGQMAGISSTDWSWSPLFADFDNDGWKDLFVTNGYVNNDNLDIKNNYGNFRNQQAVPLNLNSQFFQNDFLGGFKNVTNQWKVKQERMSYSAAYADFDNDGSLDLVISNLNNVATILKNVGLKKGNYISVKLKGKGMNSFAIGAKVFVHSGPLKQLIELEPVRGYEASQDYILHFGLGKNKEANIKVIWPDGMVSELEKVTVNRQIEINQENSKIEIKSEIVPQKYFKEIPLKEAESFRSKQNEHPDFKYQFTLPYKVSDVGQVVAAGDINKDGFMDYYIGGEAGSGKFFMLGGADGQFKKFDPGCFNLEDDNTGAIITDLDKDGNKDIIIISRIGKASQPQEYNRDTLYTARVYQNLGDGNFKEVKNVFRDMITSSRIIAIGDLYKDGNPVLFIGGYAHPLNFGTIAPSYIFKNDSKPGKFIFTNITSKVFKSANIGMITSAEWTDIDKDGFPELLISGEWMSCKLFKNNHGKLTDITKISGLSNQKGLWSFISAIDVNGDGYLDIVAGNAGQNNPFNAGQAHPMEVHLLNFDKGKSPSIPIVSCFYPDGKAYPIYYRDEMNAAVQSLRKIYFNYDIFAKSTITDLIKITKAKIDTVLKCNSLESGVYVNDGHNKFRFTPFPKTLQVSRINSIIKSRDNKLLVAGNFYGYRTQFGFEDALPIVMITSKGTAFEMEKPDQTGLFCTGEVSKMESYIFNNKVRIIVFIKNESPRIFEKVNP